MERAPLGASHATGEAEAIVAPAQDDGHEEAVED